MRWEFGVKNSEPSVGIYGRLLQNKLFSLLLSKIRIQLKFQYIRKSNKLNKSNIQRKSSMKALFIHVSNVIIKLRKSFVSRDTFEFNMKEFDILVICVIRH